jgi:hypothetical protein
MLELTGMGSVLRGIGLLYWVLAIGAVVLAIRYGKGTRGKMVWAAVAIAVFGYLPGKAMIEQHQRDAYAKEAWAYFKKLCDEKSGEKIYKIYTGVKSVLVVKPLSLATEKDLYDQFWMGDPYSDATPWDKRGESAALKLAMDWRHRSGTGAQRGLDFVEIKDESGKGYLRIHRPEANDKMAVREEISEPISKFGVAWEDISRPEDRRYWVAGSRFRVIDLSDNSIVAERIGYLIEGGFGSTAGQRRPWLTSRGIGPNGRSCPDAHDATDQWFITSVFKQQGN